MRPDLGLDDAKLAELVAAFYAAVRADALIGPVFERAIDDWEHHLEKLSAFWSSVMLGSGRYSGQPMQKHLAHARTLTPEMFARWLALWGETTTRLFPAPVAARLQERAARIGESLQLGLAFHAGRMPAPLPSERIRP